MSEVVATNEITNDIGDIRAEEQPSVEHGAEGETLAQGKRLPPGGTQVAHTTTYKRTIKTLHLVEVRGDIGISRLEACTTGREIPVVLRIEIDGSAIAEVMIILYIHIGFICRQMVAEVVIVPTQTNAEIEVPDAEVKGLYSRLMMVVKHGETAFAFQIDVDVVMTVIVGEGRTRQS